MFLAFLLLALPSVTTGDVGYFVHITDVHIDVSYKPGTNPFCSKWTCCRDDATTPLLGSHSPSTTTTDVAGMFGTPSSGKCGVPIETLDGVLEFVRTYPYEDGATPTAILLTGDNTVNDCDIGRGGCPRSQITSTVDLVGDHVQSSLSGFCDPPSCVVLRAMGNHDGEPTEYLELMPDGSWLVDHFAKFHSHYVDEKTAAFFKENGYLSFTMGKMRVIAINTQWTSASNFYAWKYPDEKYHPMTEWMDNEVKAAKENEENVIIIGHIPLAQEYTRNFPVWIEEFLNVTRKYPNVVKLSLWGHTHQNNFYITRNIHGKPITISIVTGSVLNQNKRNSVFTMIKYDKSTNEILDVLEFYNDIEQSNRDFSMKNNWHLLRSFRNDFRMKDLSPSSWDVLVSDLKTNQTLYQQFLNHRYSNYRNVECEGMCKTALFCEIEYTSMVSHDDCLSSRWKDE